VLISPHLLRDELLSVIDGEEEEHQLVTASGKRVHLAGKNKWECDICSKIFDSLYILNYHRLLEHSKYKRPPIGVG
jgi:tRNA(Ile2) C34 agmatinyltransferase TiaS